MLVAVCSSVDSFLGLIVFVKGLLDVNSVCCHRSFKFRRKSLRSAVACYKLKILTEAKQYA